MVKERRNERKKGSQAREWKEQKREEDVRSEGNGYKEWKVVKKRPVRK